jgi:cytidine deaminase
MSKIAEATLNRLIAQAKAASQRAYSRYSHFPVGAALLTDKGNIFAGCNVENASYGLTICAERNAIFHMVYQGDLKIEAIVIYTPTDQPASPCGACRQVLNEFGPKARVISVCDGPARNDTTVDGLLPGAFGPANLV